MRGIRYGTLIWECGPASSGAAADRPDGVLHLPQVSGLKKQPKFDEPMGSFRWGREFI